MQTNEQLLLAIENYLAQTEFPAEPERLYAPIGYSLAGGGKRLLAPWVPIDRIMRVLKKVRGFFVNQPVLMHHSKPPIFMSQLYHVPSV